MFRNTLELALFAASLVAFTPSGVLGGDEQLTELARSEPLSEPVVLAKQSAIESAIAVDERRQEIFQILQGGAKLQDPDLADHLWRVAGSLADRDWSPPEVKIHVVVSDLDSKR